MDPSKPVDSSFTKALPKIELHAHLSGSISRQCLHEIWLKKKARDPTFSVEDPLVLMPPGKVDFSLNTFFSVFNKSIYNLITDLESLAHATTSVLHSFLTDGVQYLELRTIPRASPTRSFTRTQYLSTIQNTITSFCAKHPQLSTYLILSIGRAELTTSPNPALEIVDLAIANHPATGNGGLVVGMDICGNPTKGDIGLAREAFAKAKASGLGLTVHFAEVRSQDSRELERELDTLLSFRPDRLGHVIHVPERVRREIMKRGLGLELCMSCNVHARMFDGGFLDHHFGDWWGVEGVRVVLCTDDVGFFCSPVSNEYLLAAEHFDLSRGDLLKMSRKGVDVIFGGEEEKERMRRLLDEFEASYSE